MLQSAQSPVPTTIFVHGFITSAGQKISKSLGNTIDPVVLAEQYGQDALRYYLLRKIPATDDGDFTVAEFIRTYNADLADQLGNLLNRVTKMIVQYTDGVVPAPGLLSDVDQQLINLAVETETQVSEELAKFALHKALAAIWRLIAATNKYVVEVEPWLLARQIKNDNNSGAKQRLATTLYVLAEALRRIAHYLTPFLPATAAAMTQQLVVSQLTVIGTHVQTGAILFPKQEG